jgi:DNA-binding transcriptional regulator YiaG
MTAFSLIERLHGIGILSSEDTAQAVTELRVMSGLNKAAFARVIGASPCSILHWESGLKMPNEANKRALIDFCNMIGAE